jgi:hypothetical protein
VGIKMIKKEDKLLRNVKKASLIVLNEDKELFKMLGKERDKFDSISKCSYCGCMTHSIPSYKEILKPKYKKIKYLICGKCKAVKFNGESK